MPESSRWGLIRSARATDMPVIQAIEAAAGAMFGEIGMQLVADGALPTDEELLPYIDTERAWVVTDDGDDAIAFILIDTVDGSAHIEQVSVHPDHAHQQHGRALIDHAASVAFQRGYVQLTLTTYRDVPWNGPYYELLGFTAIPDDEVTPGLAAIRRHEAALGLDAWPRVCMRRRIGDR
jgi:ribosomal protein S18 acetylase RimI-like enzyme